MFRFTIRDVLWLMVVVAISTVWAIARQDAAALRQRNAGLERINADYKTATERAGWNLYRDKTEPILAVPAEAETSN